MNERLSFRFMNASGTATHPVVLLGDRNIAGNVSRVEFESSVGDVPHVVLTMPLIKGATLDLAGAIVEVSPENRDLLVSIGWTPPGSEPEPEGALHIKVVPEIDDAEFRKSFVEMLRKHIRVQGGDVQKALGS